MGSTWQEIGRRYSPILHWAFYRSFAPQPRSRYNDDFSPVNGREAKKCRKNRSLTDIHVDINRRSPDLIAVHNAAGAAIFSFLRATYLTLAGARATYPPQDENHTCRSTHSGICFASPPSAKAMVRRSGAWSMD